MLLVYTTREQGHKHIAYQREDGTGSTSKSKGHTHKIAVEIVAIPQDPLVPQDPLAPQDPQETINFVLLPAGKEPHVHELTADQIVPDPKEVKVDPKNDESLIINARGLWKAAGTYEADFRKKGRESEDFFRGEQWKRTDKDLLKLSDRVSLTINETAGKIDQLSGFHRQNRLDITFFPIGGGDGKGADMVNAIVKNILEQNDFLHEENQVFEDKMIVGRGLYHTYMDFDKNMLGDLIIDRYPWDGVRLGPHDKYNLSDCEYLTKDQWYSLARLKEMYPDKANSLSRDYEAQFQRGAPIQGGKDDNYSSSDNVLNVKHPEDFFNITNKEYRVVELERKVYKRVYVLVNAKDDFYLNAEGISEDDRSAVATIEGFRSIPRVTVVMKTIVFAGSVILDRRVENGEDTFSIIPDYAKKRGRYVWGKVEAAKDAQREINKRVSQSVDIMNKTAGYGWFYDDQTFFDEKDLANFKKNSSSPGFLAKVKDVKTPPHKVEGAKFPAEIVQMYSLARESLERVMNVPPALQGQSKRAESGVALMQKKESGLVGNEYLFDNSSIAKRILGRKMLKMIQKNYSVSRLQRLLSDQGSKASTGERPLKIGDKAFGEYSDEEIADMLNNVDLTEYDVQVGESDWNVTNRRTNFFVWAQIAQNVPGIPPSMLIELSDLPNKDSALKLIQGAEQQRQKEMDAKNQTEITKTLIAQGDNAQGGAQGQGGQF